MKHPKVNQFIVLATYGTAVAIGYHNVKMSALGLASNPQSIEPVDWMLATGMAAFEFALSSAISTPAFWPVLIGSASNAIEGILGLGEDAKKYQFAALGLLVALVGGLTFATWQVYRWDILTTQAAIFPPDSAPTGIQQFKALGLVFGPECLLLGAGLLGLASGMSRVQWNQIQTRSERLASQYSDPYTPRVSGPDLNA